MIPTRRLEDRIRELCNQVAGISNGDLAEAVAALQAALNDYALRIHNKTSATVLAWPEYPQERRNNDRR